MSDIQPLAKQAKFLFHTSREVYERKRECQRRYREQNREKLRMLEAERRKRRRIQNIQLNAESSTSHINRKESNKEKISDADSQIPSGLEGTQTSAKEMNPIDRRRENKRRYRERNREILRQREAERRQRLRNNRVIAESSTSSHRDFEDIISEAIIDDEIRTNSSTEAYLEETQNLLFEIPDRQNALAKQEGNSELLESTEGARNENFGGQANENEAQISNNYSEFGGFEEDLKKPPVHAKIFNTITIFYLRKVKHVPNLKKQST